VPSKGVAGGVGALVGGVTAVVSGNLAGVVSWVLSTETVWFGVATAYNRYIAPKVSGLPELGPVLFVLFAVYLVARVPDLLEGGDEDEP
jgi:hypothetical protein